MTVQRKVPKSYFQSQLLMLKIDGIFFDFFCIALVNINLGDYFSLKTFFLVSTLLLKSCPIFWRADINWEIFFSLKFDDSLLKILLFRTRHLWNSKTEPILQYLSTVLCMLVRISLFSRFWRNHPYCRNKRYIICKPRWFSFRKNKTFF